MSIPRTYALSIGQVRRTFAETTPVMFDKVCPVNADLKAIPCISLIVTADDVVGQDTRSRAAREARTIAA